MSDEKPIDRRRFFRQGLRELLKPLAQAVEPLNEVVRQLNQLDKFGSAAADPYHSPAAPVPAQEPVREHWHRPPGALPEKQFQETCSRCGQCERVCPAQCIRIDHSGNRGNGVPFIDVDAMPCVLCDGLACMQTCPSGALRKTPVEEIDMGTAVWNEGMCVRSRGVECTICIDNCPVGADALSLQDNRVHVNEDHCTGCGVCQNRCPTNPKSIVVMVKSARVGGIES
jgi:MauM/NapG family ferredoxin protein